MKRALFWTVAVCVLATAVDVPTTANVVAGLITLAVIAMVHRRFSVPMAKWGVAGAAGAGRLAWRGTQAATRMVPKRRPSAEEEVLP